MNNLPDLIINKINFLNNNGFIITENIKNEYIYDSNLKIPSYDDKKELEKNICHYYPYYKTNLTCNYIEYFNDHHFFIQTFEKEKEFYNRYGYDSWIHHFINNIYNKTNPKYENKLDISLKYPLVIGYELNTNIEFTPIHLEIMKKNKDIIKKYIFDKKLKWFNDNDKIKNLIDTLENPQYDEEDSNYTNNDECLCTTELMKYLINCEKNCYTNMYSDDKLYTIHDKYCRVHSSYLQKNKSECEKFIKYKSDKWITFLENQSISFKKLYKNDPEDLNLCDFALINLIQD